MLLLAVRFAQATIYAAGFGTRGVPTERVADRAVTELRAALDAGAPICEHLADQLLVPLALAGAGRFRTVEPSLHTRTSICETACGRSRSDDGMVAELRFVVYESPHCCAAAGAAISTARGPHESRDRPAYLPAPRPGGL